jgi:hypothetical protein
MSDKLKPCKGNTYHDYAKSGIRIEAGIVIKKCFNCGHTVKYKADKKFKK